MRYAAMSSGETRLLLMPEVWLVRFAQVALDVAQATVRVPHPFACFWRKGGRQKGCDPALPRQPEGRN
jgi:hypothetical protein